jgi:5-methylcytosine-specific restriction endonuclease McrA
MAAVFVQRPLQLEDQWRGIILLGRNVASYKFAMAKALLELQPTEGQLLKLHELAEPFARHIAEHLKLTDTQGTFQGSRFLDACRDLNAGKLTKAQMVEQAVRLGFNNVIDAFHVVGRDAVPDRFFIDERGTNGGVRITTEFSKLMESTQALNLEAEVESRWRLVETAWELGVSRNLVSIDYDGTTQGLFAIDRSRRRTAVTSSRGALNGYQKGKCFYCSRDIQLASGDASPDVDHFFPHALKQFDFGPLVDGVWNLVLACRDCNRGVGGKSDRVPSVLLLERLWHRNEHLISSHHPLRETVLRQTGVTEQGRRAFMNDWHGRARAALLHQWEPT